MGQRDYARTNSRKKKSSNNKFLWVSIALIIILAFVAGLYFLKQKSPQPVENVEKVEKMQPKSQLPSRPEEVWSYIKDLETREIPIDDSQKSLEKDPQLTAEQKKILLMMENEKKQAEIAQKKEEERRKAEATTPNKNTEENKALESKPTPTKVVDAVKAENTKSAPKAPAKEAESVKTEAVKKVETNNAGKFGLQCGVFKSQQNAENLQARLAMLGLNARVNTSAEWNRVVVGPVGDRAAASKAQEQAKSVINCVIIGM